MPVCRILEFMKAKESLASEIKESVFQNEGGASVILTGGNHKILRLEGFCVSIGGILRIGVPRVLRWEGPPEALEFRVLEHSIGRQPSLETAASSTASQTWPSKENFHPKKETAQESEPPLRRPSKAADSRCRCRGSGSPPGQHGAHLLHEPPTCASTALSFGDRGPPRGLLLLADFPEFGSSDCCGQTGSPSSPTTGALCYRERGCRGWASPCSVSSWGP